MAVSENAAWVVISTRLDPVALGRFCEDLEQIYRLNPYLEIHSWVRAAPDRHHVDLTNLSNGIRARLDMTVKRTSPRVFCVDYASGLKTRTWFEIVEAPGGSRLTVTDDYSSGSPVPGAGREGEVDRSLRAWGVALRDFLELDRRWGWFPPWRVFARNVWLPMKPSARRITWLLAVVALAEFLFFLLIAAIYWIEHSR